MDYIKAKESLKTIGLANWKLELLKIAKESLSIDKDVKNTLMVTSLKEFESYIKATYLSSLSVMTDLYRRCYRRETVKY